MIEVRLAWDELQFAAEVGVRRRIYGLSQCKVRDGQVAHLTGYQDNVLGACGEMAVAKYLGLYWPPSIGTTRHNGVKPPDVAGYEVRTRSVNWWDLMLHKRDPDERIAILILAEKEPIFLLPGWILCADGKLPKYWDDPSKKAGGPSRPAFFIPQDDLASMETLPDP